METKIFEQAFKDFRGAIEAAAQPVRNYQRKTDAPSFKPELTTEIRVTIIRLTIKATIKN